MIVAIFSDVHGNLPALKAFESETRGRVDHYINLGDTVGYGPWPNECVEIVHDLCEWRRIEGNHERLHSGIEAIQNQIPIVQTFYRHTLQWFTNFKRIGGLADYFSYGGHLLQHADDGKAPAIVGHSHRQKIVNTIYGPIVHVGSIGQNRETIDVAQWAEFDTETGRIALRGVRYPFDALIAEMRSRHYPDECVDYYLNKPRAPPP